MTTRIHFALLRRYGEDVAVSTLLRGTSEAREAIESRRVLAVLLYLRT